MQDTVFVVMFCVHWCPDFKYKPIAVYSSKEEAEESIERRKQGVNHHIEDYYDVEEVPAEGRW